MRIDRSTCHAAVALAVALAAAPVRAEDAVPAVPEIGPAFERARTLAGEERAAALRALEPDVERWIKRASGAEERLQARYLEGALRAGLADWTAAAEAFGRAADADAKSPFADDAAFAAIRALEAAGRDAEAGKAWAKWEQKHAGSALVPEARLARAWNHLRRRDAAPARTLLDGLAKHHPWIVTERRWVLPRALQLLQDGKPGEALALLPAKARDPETLYLRALAHAQQGDRLRAAALFQEVAERHRDTPLADPARFAKANTFLAAGDPRSAADEFARSVQAMHDPALVAEAELRQAGGVFLAGKADSALALLRDVVARHAGTHVAARAQFLVGEALVTLDRPGEAIVEYNKVLTSYFQHSVAASAQYRVARSLDRMGRRADATGAYQAVVAGYPLEPEAPAAAYLAGVSLFEQNRFVAAAPYFQLVLDRYAKTDATRADALVVFASPDHQELVEASLCLLELSYHRAGNLGLLAGAPHRLLQRLPASRSPWRATALLVDSDGLAALGRHAEAQVQLETLAREFPDHPVAASATQLLAWTYAQQGRDSLAVATEERMVARWGAADPELLASALIDIAHSRFNQKRYREAAEAYEEVLQRYPAHPRRALALYQAGLCYLRIDRAGDAVDRWERLVRDSAATPLAERAWARAGDVYFQAEKYTEAQRCYRGLLEHFEHTSAAPLAMLRLAQCDYNAGRDAQALAAFSDLIARFPDTGSAREAKRGMELALYRLGQRPDGEKVLAQLVEQYPGSAFAADALFQMARRAYETKRWNDAADGFRQVVSRFPGYSAADEAQFLMADALAQAGDAAAARLALEQFIAFFPGSRLAGMVHFRTGLLLFAEKDFLRAGVAFTRALEDSTTADVRKAASFNLALCQRMSGSPDEARAALEAYRTRWPGDERADEIATQLGDLAEAAQKWDEAVTEYRAALAANPKAGLTTELHFRLGRALEQKGEPAAALASYQRAAESTDRDHAYRLSALARCAALYEAKKDYARALTAYRDIVRNARDQELVAAAADRASQLEAATKRR